MVGFPTECRHSRWWPGISLPSQERKSERIKMRAIPHMAKASTCLGYHFGPDGLTVAKKTVENFVARAIRLFGQEPGEAFASAQLGLYVRRWVLASSTSRWWSGQVGSQALGPLGDSSRPSDNDPLLAAQRDKCRLKQLNFPDGLSESLDTFSLVSVPEPSTLALFIVGLAGHDAAAA